MDFKVGIEIEGCAGFRGELCIHMIISHMMCVVLVTDGILGRIAHIRHGIWMGTNGDLAQVRSRK